MSMLKDNVENRMSPTIHNNNVKKGGIKVCVLVF